MVQTKVNDAILAQLIDEEAWKSISSEYNWNEQMLKEYSDKVDWTAVSKNSKMLWTTSLLEKFEGILDWNELSSGCCKELFTPENLEKFKARWDWTELSSNSSIDLSFELIDRFADCWDWDILVNRWGYDVSCTEFLNRYKDRLSMSELRNTNLWGEIVDERVEQLTQELTSK